MAEFYRKKKKICQMCAGKSVDYKDPEILRKYINEKGKILPRRVTGACSKHQRHIAQQVKRARNDSITSIYKVINRKYTLCMLSFLLNNW